MTYNPLVSVIVPARNGATCVPSLLDALAGQTADRQLYELLVVDDCSLDGTAELAERAELVSVIRAPRRGGSYVARNLGVAAARGRILAFTDIDCRPDPRWIERGLAAIGSAGADVVAGQVEVPLDSNPSTAALLDFTRYLDQERHVREHGFGATANLWIRREVLEQVGPFNEHLTTGGDLEWGHRATARGFDLRFAPDVVVVHRPRSRVRQLARKGFRLGLGTAQHRRYANAPTGDRPRVYARPGAYVPHPCRSLDGLKRLERNGYVPTRSRLVAMHALQYFCLQLPILAGSIVGSLTGHRTGTRPASESS